MEPMEEPSWHIYWLSQSAITAFGDVCRAAGLELTKAKGPVCAVLRPFGRSGAPKVRIVPPETWSSHCARQVSFYGVSNRAGLHLAASPVALPATDAWHTATLSLTDQEAPPLAESDVIDALAQAPVFRQTAPRQWYDVGLLEGRVMVRAAKQLGAKGVTPRGLLRIQAANHANFLASLVQCPTGKGQIPCSIGPSAYMCGACLQLFGVLGQRIPQMLVAPCPGIIRVARFTPDRLVEVRNAH